MTVRGKRPFSRHRPAEGKSREDERLCEAASVNWVAPGMSNALAWP